MISIDLDEPTVMRVVSSWHSLDKLGEVQGRVSSSGNGVHLKCFNHGLSEDKITVVRHRLGDDKRRIALDQNSEIKPDQIAFTDKLDLETGKWGEAGPWHEDMEMLITDYRFRSGAVA